MDSEGLIAKVNKALGTDVKYKKVFDTVEDLLAVIEKQQNEYITLSQSISEDDAIIEQLQEEIKFYKLQETLLLERLKKIEKNSRYLKFMKMAEENLSLAQEVALLKGEISG